MNESGKCYAIIPAAGHSRRMGKPKLLLPWHDKTVMDQVLNAWTSSGVTETVVVIRPDDVELQRVCAGWPVTIVRPPTPPADMKASVQIGLQFLNQNREPTPADHCFIAPADLPTLERSMIDRLLAARCDRSTVTVPHFGDRPGHPLLLPWPLTKEIFALAADEGVNSLLARLPQQQVNFPAAARVTDVDTPAEYQTAFKAHHP